MLFNKPRLLTPGPTPLPERVRLALAADMIHHRKPAFKKILLETEEMLQKLFGTSQPVLPLSCSGTGAMTAAVHGLFAPGEKVIVVNGGKFGERWSQNRRRAGPQGRGNRRGMGTGRDARRGRTGPARASRHPRRAHAGL